MLLQPIRRNPYNNHSCGNILLAKTLKYWLLPQIKWAFRAGAFDGMGILRGPYTLIGVRAKNPFEFVSVTVLEILQAKFARQNA